MASEGIWRVEIGIMSTGIVRQVKRGWKERNYSEDILVGEAERRVDDFDMTQPTYVSADDVWGWKSGHSPSAI